VSLSEIKVTNDRRRQQGLRDPSIARIRISESKFGFLFLAVFFHVVSRPGPESSESILPNARQKITRKADVVASYKAQKLFATPALSFTSITGANRFSDQLGIRRNQM
jgi:hypothetical protein